MLDSVVTQSAYRATRRAYAKWNADPAHPTWRASAVGVYRLWRDLGYAVGAIVAGVTADWLGLAAALWLVAALTFGSGALAALRMTETLKRRLTPP